MRYATRNDAFSPAKVWVLEGATLRFDDGTPAPPELTLANVKEVRLTFAPTRPEPNRFRCRLAWRSGQTHEFFNRTCRGVYDFADTSPEYVAFVRALHGALAQHAPGCRFTAGATGAAYAMNWGAMIFVGFMVLIAALFLIFNGLAWLIVLKIALLAIFAPSAFRWLARNKPRSYPPGEIPSNLLPLAESGNASPS